MIFTDDLDLDTKEKVLQQRISIGNMKALLPTIRKLWSMFKFFGSFSDKQTDRTIDTDA